MLRKTYNSIYAILDTYVYMYRAIDLMMSPSKSWNLAPATIPRMTLMGVPTFRQCEIRHVVAVWKLKEENMLAVRDRKGYSTVVGEYSSYVYLHTICSFI